MTYSILADGLVKRFGQTRALNGIDLAVQTGSVFGLLGPNGAGKTTAIRILATLVRPDGGHDFSVQPVMFLLLFTYVFGGAIGGSPHAYLQFALAGIIVQNSLFTTLNTATGLATDLEKGFFDRLRSLPIARFAPLAGRMVADLAKQVWAIAMLLAVGIIMGFRVGTGPLGVLAATALVLVTTLAIAWALVDELAGRHQLAGAQRQHDQQRAQPGSADLEQLPGAGADLERSEHRDLHTLNSARAWVGLRRGSC